MNKYDETPAQAAFRRKLAKAGLNAKPPVAGDPVPSIEAQIETYRKFWKREPSAHLLNLWREAAAAK